MTACSCVEDVVCGACMTGGTPTPPADDVREALDKLIRGSVIEACHSARHATTWARGGYRNDVPTLCDSCRTLILTLQSSVSSAFEVRPRGTVTDAEVEAAVEAFWKCDDPTGGPISMRAALEAARLS